MGNAYAKYNKMNFEDIQFVLKQLEHQEFQEQPVQSVQSEQPEQPVQYILINTMSANEQQCLIQGTININKEETLINQFIKKNKAVKIVLYGKNVNDEKLAKKYSQLITLGFYNISIYLGGLFEWLLLQDIYGNELFPTTSKVTDILKYKPCSSIVL